MEYALLVEGSVHENYKVAELQQIPGVYKANTSYLYGGAVIIGGDVTTPDGRFTFRMGVRQLPFPSDDLVVSFANINGSYTQIIVDMVDGKDANGYSAQDIVDIVKTAIGDPDMMSRRVNPNAENTLPIAPDDFEY